MAFIQQGLDKIIVERNKNESINSPLKYTPSFQIDSNYKPKLHGNKEVNSNLTINGGNIIQGNYYDVQHEYIKGKQTPEDYYMKNIFNRNISSQVSKPDGSPFNNKKDLTASDYKPQYSQFNVISSSNNDINKKLESEYSRYKKFYNVDRGIDEYNNNRLNGYGKNLLSSPSKDYSLFFKK